MPDIWRRGDIPKWQTRAVSNFQKTIERLALAGYYSIPDRYESLYLWDYTNLYQMVRMAVCKEAAQIMGSLLLDFIKFP